MNRALIQASLVATLQPWYQAMTMISLQRTALFRSARSGIDYNGGVHLLLALHSVAIRSRDGGSFPGSGGNSPECRAVLISCVLNHAVVRLRESILRGMRRIGALLDFFASLLETERLLLDWCGGENSRTRSKGQGGCSWASSTCLIAVPGWSRGCTSRVSHGNAILGASLVRRSDMLVAICIEYSELRQQALMCILC